MLGHDAASNAPRTSSLTIDVQFFCFKFSSMISLTTIAASISSSLSYEAILISVQNSIGMHMMHNSIYH